MFAKGPLQIRHAVVTMLDAFVATAQETAAKQGGTISAEDIDKIAEAMKLSGEMDNFYRAVFGQIVNTIVEAQHQNRRTNAFGRLVVHPLSDFFQSQQLDRGMLHNFFFFVHSLVGEEEKEWNETCATIVDELREKLGEAFTWDDYYEEPRVQAIFWRVLVKIAQAFKRFDTRREWLFRIMQHKQTSISLAPNKYVKVGDGLDVAQFSKADFLTVFDNLFAPVRNLSYEQALRFEQATGVEAKTAFAKFFEDLAAYRAEA
ncbi:MAG: hypothetical protein ACKO1J_17420 [Tagaea sp.]